MKRSIFYSLFLSILISNVAALKCYAHAFTFTTLNRSSGVYGYCYADWLGHDIGKITLELNEPVQGSMSAHYIPDYGYRYDCYTNSSYSADSHYYSGYYHLSLLEAANHLGYTGFNWIQVITHDDLPPSLPSGGTAKVPYLDPPYGGYSYLWADNQPFYYNEISPYPEPPNYDPFFDVSRYHVFSKTIDFFDRPMDNYMGSEYTHFVTLLVGVRSPINWDILRMFTWNSNFNPKLGTGGVYKYSPSNLLLVDFPDATGGAFGAQEIGIEELPESLKNFLVSLGARNIPISIPEPAILSLILVGLIALSLFRRSVA